MERTILATLQCPYTGSAITVSGRSGSGSTLDYQVVTTEAGQFPVIAGIRRLLTDDLQAPLVDLVERGEHALALKAALEVPFLSSKERMLDGTWRRMTQRWKPGYAALTGPKKSHLYRVLTEPDASFAEVARAAQAESWASWQTYRFSMPPFLPVYPLAHLAAGARRIFDFGCGLGHSAFLMKRLAPEAEVICADYSFTSMYLAKRFIIPEATCICLDGDFPLPFPEGHFDCTFSTDALQYIEPKIGIAREFRRTLAADGTLVLAHLHSRLSGIKAGKPLTPAGYHGLFDGMSRRIYPEDAIVSDYFEDGSLKLDRQFSAAEIDGAHSGISLIAGHDDRVFRRHEGLLDRYVDAMLHPAVNPAYQMNRTNGKAVLQRTIDAPYAVQRDVAGRQLLPNTWAVDGQPLGTKDLLGLRDARKDSLRELVRRLVVVDVPANYL